MAVGALTADSGLSVWRATRGANEVLVGFGASALSYLAVDEHIFRTA
jgi:hypothetical protein